MDWQDRIEAKVDELHTKIDSMRETVTKNTADVEHHIKRTDALEERMELAYKEADARIEPLEKWKDGAKGVMWFMGVIATGVGLWWTILRITQ